MATIQNTLALNDRMSSTFTSITKAMHSTLSAMKQVSSSNSNLSGSFDKATTDILEAEKALKSYNQQLEETKNNSDQTKNKLGSVFTSLVGWGAVLKGLGSAMSASDTYVQTQARLNMINDGQQTLQQLEDDIYASAQRSRASYNDTADAVAKLQMRARRSFQN